MGLGNEVVKLQTSLEQTNTQLSLKSDKIRQMDTELDAIQRMCDNLKETVNEVVLCNSVLKLKNFIIREKFVKRSWRMTCYR